VAYRNKVLGGNTHATVHWLLCLDGQWLLVVYGVSKQALHTVLPLANLFTTTGYNLRQIKPRLLEKLWWEVGLEGPLPPEGWLSGEGGGENIPPIPRETPVAQGAVVKSYQRFGGS
jgi:hypothetical protein